jgi:hypothetical protein
VNEYEALALAAAAKKKKQQAAPNPDGTYGQPPEGYFPDPRTGGMTSREMLRNNTQTSRAGAASAGFLTGHSFGTADEMMGALGYAEGGAEMANLRREQARAKMEAQAEEYPGTFVAGEITGAVTSPVNRAAPAVTTVKGGATVGAGYAAAEGFGRGEGDFMSRAKNATISAPIGFFSSAATTGLFKGASKLLRNMATRTAKRPTIENLRNFKNSAYAEVRRSGVKFDESETINLWSKLDDLAKDPRWDLDEIAEVDKPAFDALRVIERRTKGPVSLNNLDKTRQKLWDIYKRSDHPYVLEVIAGIDDTIATKAKGNEVMLRAREANSRLAKAELLENAFHKARLQTASTGSGGNILNKYRQAVTRIITNPNEARWFSKDELAIMEQFVFGDGVENTLRRAGKLSPSGNGLMTALNVYAAAVDPSMLAITAAGATAKSMADRSAMNSADNLVDAAATGVIKRPPAPMDIKDGALATGVAANRLLGF